MAETLTLNIDGEKELARSLQALPDKVQKKVVGQATNKAATPVVRAVRRAAPVGKTGRLKKSTKKILRRRTKTGPSTIIGHAWPMGAHAHLVENGTKPRRTLLGGGRYAGAAKAHPYLVPTWNTAKAAADRDLREELVKGIEREAAKLAAAQSTS